MATIHRRRLLTGALAGLGLAAAQFTLPALTAAAEAIDARFADYYGAYQGPRVLGPAISRPEGNAQYFEKGRLEDHRGQGLPREWDFMYGRLVADLIEAGAAIPVAGDSGPTYADLRALADPARRLAPPARVDGVQAQSGGGVFIPFDPALRAAPGYQVPAYFWLYITNTALFPGGWLHDIGLPLTAAFAAAVTKAGQIRPVIIQAYERTVLTYDPANPADWQVERANVGLHYLLHRRAPAQPTYPDWKGEYFANDELSGRPVLVRNDRAISFDWSGSSPGAGVPHDSFSVRWTRTLTVTEEGTYRVQVDADDGARVWVNERLLIDDWKDAEEESGYIHLKPGRYPVRVEYRERSGAARIEVDLERIENYSNWKGVYYNNDDLSGTPYFIRNDRSIDFNWGATGPGSGVRRDRFSVRWTRSTNLAAGTYRFTVTADGGVRLYVDGTRVLDRLTTDAGPATYVVDVPVRRGKRDLRLDYRELRGNATVKLSYVRLP